MGSASKTTGTAHQQTWFHYLAALVFLVLAIVATFEMRIREPVPGFNAAMENAIKLKKCEGQPVLTRYTGIDGLDLVVQVLVTAFLPGTVGLDKGFQIMQAYFLVGFFPVISTWCVESGRKGNRWTWIAFPALYSLFYQTVGGAIVVPCYYLAYMYTAARRKDYFTPDSTAVPVAFARALTPSLTIGYLLPTILMYLPGSVWDDATRQRLIALWQPSPLYVSVILQVLTWILSVPSSKPRSRTEELKYLRTLYVICFVVSSVWHIGTVVYCLTSDDPDVSFGAAFDLRRTVSDSPLIGSFKYIFQVDFWVIFAASLLWAYMAVYDMRRLGSTHVGMVQTFVYFVLGIVLFGPAAVLSATWYWRESLLHKAKTS